MEREALRIAKDERDPDLEWMDFDLWRDADRFSLKLSQLGCPACLQRMIGMEYGGTGVRVDYCKPCEGVWLDGGGFEALVAALQAEAASKSAAGYVRASLLEALEIATGPESLSSEWKDFSRVLCLLGRRIWIENPNIGRVVVAFQRSI